MTDTKHTPGPWEVRTEERYHQHRGRQYISYPGSNWRIAVVTMQGAATHNKGMVPALPTDEAKANARLIAAAPAMLDALEDIRDYSSEESYEEDAIGRKRLAEAAINSAKEA